MSDEMIDIEEYQKKYHDTLFSEKAKELLKPLVTKLVEDW